MKLTVTYQEAIEIIREHQRLSSNVEIEITGGLDDLVCDTTGDDGWVNVPSDWEHDICPPHAAQFDQIQVQYEDGSFGFGRPFDWSSCWDQSDGHASRIVKFRSLDEKSTVTDQQCVD